MISINRRTGLRKGNKVRYLIIFLTIIGLFWFVGLLWGWTGGNRAFDYMRFLYPDGLYVG